MARATADGAGGATDDATWTAHVVARLQEQGELEREIATLEDKVAALPTALAELDGHPVLWLLLGREGVDRPGALGAIVGQQVVTVMRRDWWSILLVGVLALLLGSALGVGGIYLWGGI